MAAPEIRRAAPPDVAGIEACVAASYAKWVAVLGYEPYPMIMDYAAAVRDHDVWIVELDGAVAGLLVLIDQGAKLLLENVAVAPAHQRRGLGDLLLNHALARAKTGGYRALVLYTNERMHENRAWYAARGFSDTGREERADRVIVHMERAVSSGVAGRRAAEPWRRMSRK